MPKSRDRDDRVPVGGADDGIDDNLPGFAFAQRMVTAWSNALTAMGETFNQSWSDIQQGRYDFSGYMKTLTSTYAASFDALMEFWKGPTFRASPQWLHFRFKKSQGREGSPDVLTGTVRLDKKWGRDVNLETVPFERLGEAPAKAGKAANKDATDLWSECGWLDDLRRDAVDVSLNVSAVRSLAAGQYLGFVLASGTTAEPPLVIVVLQVVD
jgi:hypothetical protein